MEKICSVFFVDGLRCDRTGRLLSNPLGLFGHNTCVSDSSGSGSSQGLCYNELECLAGGGTISGYCSPAALGVCCVFKHSNCGRTVKQKISYFTNPNYPLEDKKPIACLLKESDSFINALNKDFLLLDITCTRCLLRSTRLRRVVHS